MHFYPLGTKKDFLFRYNFNDSNISYSNKADFFAPKGIIYVKNNFYSAEIVQSFRRMNRCISLGKKFMSLIVKFSLDFSIKDFSKAEDPCVNFVMIHEIP